MLTLTTAVTVMAGALAGGFVSGLAGFGTGLVALGFWLYVIDPAPAVTLAAICSVVAQVQTIPAIWHAVDVRRVWPMVVAGLVGVPFGTALLSSLDPGVFRATLGVLLIAFSTFMLLSRFQPRISWGGRKADAVVGFAGGVLGGLAGLSGPLPTVWATLRGWGKHERRGVFQVFNLSILAAVVAWHLLSGLFTVRLLLLVAVAMPGTFAGTWLGAHAYRRLSDQHFHEVLLVLLGLSGIALVWATR
jgi:uncharacterized membrane protein YfcA